MYTQEGKQKGGALIAVLFVGFFIALMWVMLGTGGMPAADEGERGNMFDAIDDAEEVRGLMDAHGEDVNNAL